MQQTSRGFPSRIGALATLLAASPLFAASPLETRYQKHAVTSGHVEASGAGLDILRQGGDAVDAAIAVMAGLGFATPMSSGLGGGFFALVYRADEGKTYVLDAREIAPALAHPKLYVEDGVVRSDKARWGGLSVAVPGEVRGMQLLHQRFGKLPWSELFEPVARRAEVGIPTNSYVARVVEWVRDRFERAPRAKALYLNQGRPYQAGEIYRNPALAKTLRELARRGADWFYTGELGAEIVAAVQDQGGILQAQDLTNFRPTWREPLRGRFGSYEIHTMPPPSSGGLVLLEVLKLLEGQDLSQLGWNSSAYLHQLAEAMRFGYADRARFMGDPAFTPVPVQEILAPRRLASMRASISPFRAKDLSQYARPLPEDGGTSHFCVRDSKGNVVSATTTINYAYGSLVVVPGRGFVLNDQMDDFAIQPGVANLFGLVGTDANQVEAGKKPLSSMTPTLVFEGGEPRMALGGSGGPRIISGTLQVLLNRLVFGRDLEESVSAPRIHHQWKPDRLRVEPELSKDVTRALEARGHILERKDYVGGRVQALHFGTDGIAAAADPRKQGRPQGD